MESFLPWISNIEILKFSSFLNYRFKSNKAEFISVIMDALSPLSFMVERIYKSEQICIIYWLGLPDALQDISVC